MPILNSKNRLACKNKKNQKALIFNEDQGFFMNNTD